MLVKDFVMVSTYDYIDIVRDGELVETYDKENSTYIENANATIVSINPIKGCWYYIGIELEIEP